MENKHYFLAGNTILPARVANHSAGFVSSCSLTELAIYKGPMLRTIRVDERFSLVRVFKLITGHSNLALYSRCLCLVSSEKRLKGIVLFIFNDIKPYSETLNLFTSVVDIEEPG